MPSSSKRVDPSFIRESLRLLCGLFGPREPADGRKDQDRTLNSLGSGAAVLWAIAMSIEVYPVVVAAPELDRSGSPLEHHRAFVSKNMFRHRMFLYNVQLCFTSAQEEYTIS
ncbi:hypothetical protein [Pseudomonas phage S50]|uniref:Uncharacterized protein n=1 Tax=Pseudomonas phage S50 TaxID=2562638 RepID=A0A455XAN7_9CAUD|nr:hypothetical protein PALZ7_73 [Pseudomonas phage PA_LZ7]WPF70465.1 hypothetical protein [Pseudomonas phage BL3]BBJ26982.1 hypothetical protein [Pseudomonas phage S50]